MVELIGDIKKKRTPETFLIDLIYDVKIVKKDYNILYYSGEDILFEKTINGYLNVNDCLVWDIFIKKYYLTPLQTYYTIKRVMKQYMGMVNIEPIPTIL